ncbi:MAG: sigW 4 [Verrucomicrobiales bacterium]|nr:sigW 4 [Verrucomicrobiales bacterium]
MAPSSIARLYDAFAPSLHRFLLSLTGNEADTRDLLQDLFVKLARRTSQETVRDEQAWLFRAARNLTIDLARRRMRGRRMLEDFAGSPNGEPDWLTPGAKTDEFPAELQQRAASLLMALPEEQRAVVHLKLWEDLTFARIAEVLGIPANTAASRYRYAMQKMRQALKPAEPLRYET